MSTTHKGPNLVAVGLVHALLFLAAALLPTALNHGAHVPMPTDVPSSFFDEHSHYLTLGGMLLFGSAVPLAIYTATATSRLTFLGLKVAGVSIALVGGVLAAALVMISGLTQVALAHTASREAQHALHWLMFLTGGPGAVVALGLLVAGLAVTTGLTRQVARPLALAGVALALIGELATFVLVTPHLVALVPLARFGAMIWLVVFAAKVSSTRADR